MFLRHRTCPSLTHQMASRADTSLHPLQLSLRPRCCNALGPARLLHPVTVYSVSRGLLIMESPLVPDFTEHSSGFIATVLQCETLWECCAGKCFLLHKCERVMVPHAS